ncbi:MAG: ribonuclease R [Pseudomonadales bacterium]|nr:ribonuclease R [Pseudomonadales bacterium]
MSKTRKKRDPFAAREAENYTNPIASRELILSTLEKANKPCSQADIAELLAITAEEPLEALRRRIRAMTRDGQINWQRKDSTYTPVKEDELIRGRVLAHKDGFGFVVPEKGGEDIYLHFREMRKVFNGDIVDASITQKKRSGKLEGEIRRVVERRTEKVVGKVIIEADKIRVIPDNPKIQHTVFIEQDFDIAVENEQIVVATIIQQPEARKAPTGIITEVLGNSLDPGMEIDMAIRTFEIPYEWPEAVEKEAAKFNSEPSEKDKKGRIDLRDLPLVTIDGEDARDFDDAVYCEKKKSGGWRLWVAIADVSHYVSLNSALDNEAHTRSTSVYFPERVVPMLPEQLSNGLCSLKPAVDRLCMVCEMTISAKGKLSGYQFYEAVMHSHARLTYTEVGKILLEKGDADSPLRNRYEKLLKPLDELHNLYTCLRGQREKRGAVEFDTVETRIIFDTNRKIDSIQPVVRNDAHKLIEECMLCANVAAARFLEKHKIDALFRVHDGPKEKKLGNLRGFLAERGLNLAGGDKPTPQDYLTLFEDIKGREDSSLLQIMMLRSMSQAAYEPDNRGHFGLAYSAYAHFTSPIRRYPDLLMHRAIRSVIRSEQEPFKSSKQVRRVEGQKPLALNKIYPYDMAALLQLGEHCSMAERRADDATRDVVAWLKCEYLQEHLGETFGGIIASVASFGFFVEIDDLHAEGMVHVSTLGKEFFNFDAGKQRLIGEKSHRVFHIGDRVQVQVSKVDLDERKVHLILAGEGADKNNHQPMNQRQKLAKGDIPGKSSKKPRKRPAKSASPIKKTKKKSPSKPGKKKRKTR